ncbi:hypothetical protein CYMTET_2664 [Cymbomonas tetramitiformis]|uniref:Uncharacterized protein n=1 Tax=Cymbomonas tetramitiformis TaxID=36881 RepID=A0AAE0H596_9CHLO|nr:hypothetical protein CYMTET_2664 [Cymbomonas tetramitiformis]|eukprot:gene787-1260_t
MTCWMEEAVFGEAQNSAKCSSRFLERNNLSFLSSTVISECFPVVEGERAVDARQTPEVGFQSIDQGLAVVVLGRLPVLGGLSSIIGIMKTEGSGRIYAFTAAAMTAAADDKGNRRCIR